MQGMLRGLHGGVNILTPTFTGKSRHLTEGKVAFLMKNDRFDSGFELLK